MAKAKKAKISKVKRNNQTRTKLTRQGKIKTRRHKPPKKQVQKEKPEVPENVEEESDQGEDLMSMVEKDDLEFLEQAISNKSYNLLKQIRLNEPDAQKPRRKKKINDEETLIEEKYEDNISKINEEHEGKRIKLLLPVKTKDGIVEQRIIEENVDDENTETGENVEQEVDENEPKEEDSDAMEEDSPGIEDGKTVSTAELLACREEVLKSRKLKIGLLSSSLLENPEIKSGNFKILLELMEETNPETCITVKKLATVSLLEVFKDLLPSYHILQLNQEGVKLKKETLQLQKYESVLISSYKHYLQKLEKMAGILRKKRGDSRVIHDRQIQLAELAVKCMCDLLVTHPYFNFSVNIANFLILLLDNKRVSVRETIANCISQVFKEDKKEELSLSIVRKINSYIKQKGHSVHSELLKVLLSLRIKDINLDKEKEDDTKQKKLMSHKNRVLALSKRERKRSKKLEEIEKELLETKAEENKQKKQKLLTEIISIVFTIYFRILKESPNSKILSACLEGVAKFAHCINLDYYQDLMNVLNHLMENGNLGLREQLHCIQTVFTILSGQGSALNIDPYRFYSHLYKNLLSVHLGKTEENAEIVIKILIEALVNKRKRLTQGRFLSFIKRISTLALQLQHHGALGCLGIVKNCMQLNKAIDILLDTDNQSGDGFYQPELEEPEYCNAHCTSLWELIALQRHYHPTVKKIAENIANGVPTTGKGSLTPEIGKLSPEELYNEYNPNGVAFKPAVPIPRKSLTRKSNHLESERYQNCKLKEYIDQRCDPNCLFEDGFVNFYLDFQSKQ